MEQAPAGEGREFSILVVDDEKNVREGLALVLQRKGYRTEVASSAQNALIALRRQAFSVVITDLRMPEQDGLDLLKEAKAEWPDLPFIIMTAYGEISSYLIARQGGAVEYFNKPVRIEDLMKVLDNLKFRQAPKRPVGEDV